MEFSLKQGRKIVITNVSNVYGLLPPQEFVSSAHYIPGSKCLQKQKLPDRVTQFYWKEASLIVLLTGAKSYTRYEKQFDAQLPWHDEMHYYTRS